MKKLTNLFLMTLLGLSLVACGTRGKEGEKGGQGPQGDKGPAAVGDSLSESVIRSVAANGDVDIIFTTTAYSPVTAGHTAAVVPGFGPGVRFGLHMAYPAITQLASPRIPIAGGAANTFANFAAGSANVLGRNSITLNLPANGGTTETPFTAARSYSIRLYPAPGGDFKSGDFSIDLQTGAGADTISGTATGTYLIRAHNAAL